MGLGAALVALAQAGMAAFALHGPFLTHLFPLMLLSGLGMSLVVAPLTAAVMAHGGAGSAGAASGINNAMARVATLLGVAGMGRLARAAYGSAGPGFGAAAADPAHAAATLHAFATLAGVAAVASTLAAGTIALTLLRRASPRPGDTGATTHGRTPAA
jgi:hypothetical protein